jgi:superfamily II DNA or RNA helicase
LPSTEGIAHNHRVEKFGVIRYVGALTEPTEDFWNPKVPTHPQDSWAISLPTRIEDSPHWPTASLRRPQLGAIQAVLSHWSTGATEPATVVLPTGSGKTDTMIAILAAARFKKLLVVVPTDALRTQLAAKFETMGMTREFGLLPDGALNPRVGRLIGGAKTAAETAAFVDLSDVIVATPNSLNACSEEARSYLVAASSAVFFDEAHHVRAQTWSVIRDRFAGRPIVQFTATPFREDNRSVDGKFVYVYPLREAQKDNIYGQIRYRSVFDIEDPDGAIARLAVELLLADLADGFEHLLMARCDTRTKAAAVLRIYETIAPQLNPVLVHAGLGKKEQQDSIRALQKGASRIVVCVDMLGEGFDLPELKVAAFHDPKRSLAPTLQLVGRFARVNSSVGDATVVAARSERLMDKRLGRLYGEDPDWNLVIRELTATAVSGEQAVAEFEAGFGSDSNVVATRTVAPKMSAVVFRTKCEDWNPQAVSDVFHSDDLMTDPLPVNHAERVMWFAIRRRSQVEWLETQTLEDVDHSLYVMHWDAARGLLFINHSANEGVSKHLAEAVCGDDVELIMDDIVYRAMGDIDRPIPTNVGVLDIYNHAHRFSMYAGANVSEGFTEAEESTKVQTNIFVVGFSNGERATVGASRKGRIWSYLAAKNILDWVRWCGRLGAQLVDTSIDVDKIRRNFIKPVALTEWPSDIPVLALQWPTKYLTSSSETFRVRQGSQESHLFDIDIRVDDPRDSDGHVIFTVYSEDVSAAYELRMTGNGMRAVARGEELVFDSGRSQLAGAEFISRHGVIALMGGDAIVSPPGILLRPDADLPKFDRAKIVEVDWTPVKINRESRGVPRDEATVQGLMLRRMMAETWNVIVDDDGAGEVADLVALRREADHLSVQFVHCKFAIDGKTGARVADLYELCGQAHKSAIWKTELEAMLQRLVRRERSRLKKGKPSGMEQGAVVDLLDLIQDLPALRTTLAVTIVQPALTRNKMSPAQLELLGATSTYLRQVAGAELSVVGNVGP